MSWKPEEEEQVSAAIPLIGRPIDPDNDPKTQKSFWLSIRMIWAKVKGDTAYDVTRMREAGVQHVIGKGRKPAAEAELIVSEAVKTRAEAEVKIAAAAAIRSRAIDDSLRARSAAMKEFAETVTILKQAGGGIGFDFADLGRAVFQNDLSRAASSSNVNMTADLKVQSTVTILSGPNEKVPGEHVGEEDQDREDERIQESYYDQPNYQADDDEEESESIDADGESESSEEDESSLEEEPAP